MEMHSLVCYNVLVGVDPLTESALKYRTLAAGAPPPGFLSKTNANRRDSMSFFEEIQEFVQSGQELSAFHDEEPILYAFLSFYYQSTAYGYDNPADVPEDAVPKELALPLEARPSGVFHQLRWLLSHGVPVNAPGDWQPLMPPVGNLDVAMTAYLLACGADPHFDLLSDGTPYGCGNYYIDDLDCVLLDESFVTTPDRSTFDRALQIALLFAKYGVTDVKTYCISIDSKTRTVTVKQARGAY